MYNRKLVFVEPHVSGGVCRIELTERQAIDWYKKATCRNVSDEEALQNFIAVNWAWYKHEKKKKPPLDLDGQLHMFD